MIFFLKDAIQSVLLAIIFIIAVIAVTVWEYMKDQQNDKLQPANAQKNSSTLFQTTKLANRAMINAQHATPLIIVYHA